MSNTLSNPDDTNPSQQPPQPDEKRRRCDDIGNKPEPEPEPNAPTLGVPVQQSFLDILSQQRPTLHQMAEDYPAQYKERFLIRVEKELHRACCATTLVGPVFDGNYPQNVISARIMVPRTKRYFPLWQAELLVLHYIEEQVAKFPIDPSVDGKCARRPEVKRQLADPSEPDAYPSVLVTMNFENTCDALPSVICVSKHLMYDSIPVNENNKRPLFGKGCV
jgi:hypothetical protein